MEKVYTIRKNLGTTEYYYGFDYWQNRKNELLLSGGKITRTENNLTAICKDKNHYVFDIQII